MKKREVSFINLPTSKVTDEEEKDGPEIEIIHEEIEVVTESDAGTYDTNHSDDELMINEEYFDHLNYEEGYGSSNEGSHVSDLSEYENDITVVGRTGDTLRRSDILSVDSNSLRRENISIGLSNDEINNLCTYRHSDIITKISECGICQSLFDDSNPVTELWCSHTFHSICLIPWLISNNNCPMCRRKVIER